MSPLKKEKERCFGNKPGQELLAEYHDNEWGVPKYNDTALFELLCLEGAQAGLSWEIILKKRQGYRKSFFDFDPKKVAALTDAQLEARLKDPNIIRNRLKIFSIRKNAIAFLAIQKEFGSFAAYLWKYVDGKQIIERYATHSEAPTQNTISNILAKDLKKRGFSFVGPTIIYAFIQAAGLLNTHLNTCIKA